MPTQFSVLAQWSIVVFISTVFAGTYIWWRSHKLRERLDEVYDGEHLGVSYNSRRAEDELREVRRRKQAQDEIGWAVSDEKKLILKVKIALSFTALPFVAFVIIWKGADTSAKDFAYTTFGTILGFWLSGR
jgi:hypothetical protein